MEKTFFLRLIFSRFSVNEKNFRKQKLKNNNLNFFFFLICRFPGKINSTKDCFESARCCVYQKDL